MRDHPTIDCVVVSPQKLVYNIHTPFTLPFFLGRSSEVRSLRMSNQIQGIQSTQSQSSQGTQSSQVSQVVAIQEQYARHMSNMTIQKPKEEDTSLNTVSLS